MYVPGLEAVVHRWWKGWVLRGRRPAPPEGPWRLHLTARYRFSVSAAFLAFSALYTSVFFFMGQPFSAWAGWQRWGIMVGSVLIWALFTGAFLAMLVEEVRLDEEGLGRRSLLHGRQRLTWNDMDRCDPGADDTIAFHSASGRSVSVSLYLDGLAALRECVERHLGPDAADRTGL